MDNEYYEFELKREMFLSVIQAGQTILKTCVVCSGLMFSLMLISIRIFESPVIKTGLTDALLIFGLSTVMGIIATGLTYITQVLYQNNKEKLGTRFNIAVAMIVTLNIVGLLSGIIRTYLVLKGVYLVG